MTWSPLEFLTLRFACIESPSICEVQLRFSTLAVVSLLIFSFEFLLWVSHDSLYSPVCLEGSNLFFILTFLIRPKQVVEYLLCSSFYFLFKWSGNFQATCTWNWKLEDSAVFVRQGQPKSTSPRRHGI